MIGPLQIDPHLHPTLKSHHHEGPADPEYDNVAKGTIDRHFLP
jgi:hypothetical protein